jgi:ABC-2 type transport system ATP-binding protein
MVAPGRALRSQAMGTPAILTEDLARSFGERPAVDGVSLEIAEGEIYGFLGPNGAGKTTLVRMLCTLLRPDRGRALVAGHDVVAEAGEVRLRIGVALQEAALDERQTGRELLDLQGRLYGLGRAERRRRIDEVLALVDIGDAIDRLVKTYSGGMKRRLDLAAALVHDPEIVFLDEPTTGLDPVSRAAVWEEVRRLNREHGTTIFLTTQYLEEADELAMRVGIISRGRLVAEGSPEELKRRVGDDVIEARVARVEASLIETLRRLPGVEEVAAVDGELHIRSSDGAAAMSPVAVALHNAGASVERLTLRRPTLDDVFLELTGSHLEQDAPVRPSP